MKRLNEWKREEREKLHSLSPKQKAEYIWEYYKLWLIGLAAVVFLVIPICFRVLTAPTENWFFAVFANTNAELGKDSDLYRDFAEYADYDLKEKNLVFNNQCYCKPSTQQIYENTYYELLISYIDSEALDVVIMEQEDLQALGATGRLLDLTYETALLSKYSDRLITCIPQNKDNGTEPIPIGIDLSGSVLCGEGKPYPEGCVLGISAYSTHRDQVERFLDFLYKEES